MDNIRSNWRIVGYEMVYYLTKLIRTSNIVDARSCYFIIPVLIHSFYICVYTHEQGGMVHPLLGDYGTKIYSQR